MNLSQTCPSCEFERGNAGRPVTVEPGLLLCRDCGSRWRMLEKTQQSPKFDLKTNRRSTTKPGTKNRSDFFSGKTTVKPIVDNSIQSSINIPKQSATKPNAQRRSGTSQRISANFVLTTCMIPIAAVIGVWTYDWYDPGKTNDLVITGISMEKMRARSDAVRVVGTIENNSGKSLPLRQLQMIIYSKEGKRLHQWIYTPPRDFLGTDTKLQFASAVGSFDGHPERVEVKFAEGI